MELPAHISQAIEHYRNGTATTAEMQLLNDFYHSFDNESTEVDARQLGERIHLEKNGWEEINKRIRPQAPVAGMVNRRVYRLAGMAASIVLAVVAVYLLFRPRPEQQVVQGVTVKDRSPGGNKAILILADGRTVELNNVQNGSLAQQGNTQVVKLENGRLAYQPSAANSAGQAALFNTIQTPRGGQYQVVLPDGSKVWLNAASSVKFPVVFTGAERNIEVMGEVYMEIAKNAAQPFTASVDGIKVKVLGTSFNINAYKDEGLVQTTLLEGSISVSAANNKILLKPGEQATGSVTGLTAHAHADLEQVMAWKNGFFQFNSSDIQTVMRQVERWYDIEVKFNGPVPNTQFNGKMDRGVTLLGFVRFLAGYGIKAKLEGRVLTISA
jgi:ferric-dicitrate binding protein FerR (iron transport regulator)